MRVSSYLELNWLAKADKYILLPPVIFADIPEGGFFHFPRKEEVLIGDKYYPADRGLIIINSTYSSEEIEDSLAHEWRHLWQYYQRGEPEWCVKWDFESPLSYKKQTIKYYTSDPEELDAFLFAFNKSPCENSKECYEWIIKR